jgi:Type III restriction enzyme, res subunit/LAGLIDADG-like domain
MPKCVISNRIYIEANPSLSQKLREELTYQIPTYGDGPPLTLHNFSTFRPGILTLPSGRTDLIPENYEIVDKRIRVPVVFPDFNGTLRESQQQIHDVVDDNCMINAKVGWGKAQPANSKIRTPTGWTTMGSIQIGDSVITPCNSSAKVTNKYFHTNKDIYKITLEDDRVVEACDEHLWKTINPNGLEKILTTKEILNCNYYTKGRGMYLPLSSPIEGEISNHIIHPYLLGVILGDGGISSNAVMISSADTEIIEKLQKLLPKGHNIAHVANYDYRITGPTGLIGSNIILNELRRLNLMGTKSNSKFIPEEYKNLTLQNRLYLIQGLLDTDGCVDKGNTIDYNTVSKQLAADFRDLIFSIGGVCSQREKNTSCNGKAGQLCYELSPKKLPFDIKQQLFSLKRKVARIKPGQYDNSGKIKIKSIVLDRQEDCWCIAIDSVDKLYLTDNYIVTHNTFMALALAKKLGQKTLIVVHTLALMHQWAKEVKKVFGITPGLIGDGHNNTNEIITIGSLYKRMDKLGKAFGTIIQDECHHSPSPTFAKVLDRSYARYKIGLSGTLQRKDGMHIVLTDYFGHKIYKPPAENTMAPKVHVYDTGLVFPYGDIWAHRVTELMISRYYQDLVVALTEKYKKLGHKVLIVSDRVDFLKIISERTNSALIIGETTDREAEFDSLVNGKDSICGTLSIFKEGISYNPLSVVILGTPINNHPMLEQLIGRIQRMFPGKLDPIVVDLLLRGRTTEKQFMNRAEFYLKEGFEVIHQ